MIDDEYIDYELEHTKAINKLVKLKQKYDELEEDRDYIKSLLDVEFEKRIKLQKENEQLKEEIQFLFNQIKAFRDDCRIYQDFDGASTLNRLIEILEQSKEIFE